MRLFRFRRFGTRLLAPGLAAADDEGLPCYLETEKERNLPFYGRHRFDVTQHLPEPVADAPAEHEEAASGAWSGSNALAGAALCVFGVLCGLTFLVALRTLWRRRISPVLSEVSRVPSLLAVPALRAHPVVLSLTQLGLSRT